MRGALILDPRPSMAMGCGRQGATPTSVRYRHGRARATAVRQGSCRGPSWSAKAEHPRISCRPKTASLSGRRSRMLEGSPAPAFVASSRRGWSASADHDDVGHLGAGQETARTQKVEVGTSMSLSGKNRAGQQWNKSPRGARGFPRPSGKHSRYFPLLATVPASPSLMRRASQRGPSAARPFWRIRNSANCLFWERAMST
jgi:hypothetical protein